MNYKKKNVLILFCGGSISMIKNEKTGSLDVARGVKQILDLEPRIVEIANINVEFIDNVDSTDLNIEHWERLIDLVKRNYHKYDGFIVTSGSNTMAYASAALSYAFEEIGKPVVFTGAQIPAEFVNTDGRSNLYNALRVATMNLSGVYIVFGSKIILGCRAKKISESKLDAFETFQGTDVGEISIGIKLSDSISKRNNKPLVVKNGFEDNIICLTLVPGLKAKYLINIIDEGIKGIVLRAYGPGDIPHTLHKALAYAQKKEIPVLVTTQCPSGATAIGINRVGFNTLKLNPIQVFDMCMESITTKLMWLLNKKVPYSKMKEIVQKSLRGEVDSSMAEILLNKKIFEISKAYWKII